jgi:hypothetical protein
MKVIATVLLTLVVPGRAIGETQADFWRAVFEGKPGIRAVGTVSPFPGVDLARPLVRCDRLSPIPNRPVTSLSLQIDLGDGRRPTLDVWISELPPGERAHQAILAAGNRKPADVGDPCTLSMRGLSLIQVGRYWIGLPTLCRRGYYKSAVATALVALRAAFPADFPQDFIFSPCGGGRVEPSTTAAFLKLAPRAAQPAVAD